MHVINVVGARPNFMKIAPIMRAMKKTKGMKPTLVHTGQHYDQKMSKSFFDELDIPKPDINLNVGSGTHTSQTAEVMLRFEEVVENKKPDLILVVGDVNSTMACSLVGSKLRIPVAHVESGLRSGDRDMPEEINRLVTDSISDILITTSTDADANLIAEGVPKNRIFFTGNVMIDNLMHNLPKAKQQQTAEKMGLKPKTYTLVTLHRPSNVDTKASLSQIMAALERIQQESTIIFPVHPRTRANIEKFVTKSQMKRLKNIRFIEPQSYFNFLNLMMNAALVLTDSGGIQEETTVLGVPCLTARENTERPVTITEGTNKLVGTNKDKIITAALKSLHGKAKSGRRPKYWDGKAAERIVKVIQKLESRGKLLRT